MNKQFHEYAHNIARNYNPEDYDDVYQQAWVYLLEAENGGVKGLDCFFEARFRSNLWANFQNRLVALPPRTGSKDLAEAQETDHEVYDHTITTSDHAEAYELLSEVQHLKKNMSKLNPREQGMLHHVYFMGKSFRNLAEEFGHNKDWWQKYHSQVISKLKLRQERK